MSNEKQETVDDIVREMRDCGNLDRKSTDRIPRSLMGLGLRTYADRLKAAAKRERESVTNSHAIGNAAALREALKMFVDAYRKTSYSLCIENLRLPYQQADAALAKPPRNCDLLFGADSPVRNADEAWLVFKQHNHDAYFDNYGLLRCIDWLLAPTTEQKGGAR